VAAAEVIEALRAGRPVLLPTDTVYGLAASAARESDAAALYRLKGRGGRQPVSIVAASLEQLLESVPELQGTGASIAQALLPGPFTLVLRNPERRYPWLTGDRPDTIGVRVPDLPEAARRVVETVGCVAATSANDPGGPDPVSLDDVPDRIRAGCGAELDVGKLPGIASTVIDFTGTEPRVLREGAAPSADALARVRAIFRAE
jgi:L-threonylcarbamoyladenylate synthase